MMTIVTLVLVIGGWLAADQGPDWLIGLSFLGLFGSLILREVGVLRWRDEFQREAVMRAGMHALIAVGLVVTLVMATQGFGGTSYMGGPVEYADAFPVSVVFWVLAVTWGLSWLLQFWGARQGAFRILLMFMAVLTLVATVSLVFTALRGHQQQLHAIITGYGQLAMGWLAVMACRRWPRVTGTALVAVTALALKTVLPTLRQFGGLDGYLAVLVAVVMPLLVPAAALIFSREEPAEA
jgi:hypothetical protein